MCCRSCSVCQGYIACTCRHQRHLVVHSLYSDANLHNIFVHVDVVKRCLLKHVVERWMLMDPFENNAPNRNCFFANNAFQTHNIEHRKHVDACCKWASPITLRNSYFTTENHDSQKLTTVPLDSGVPKVCIRLGFYAIWKSKKNKTPITKESDDWKYIRSIHTNIKKLEL